MFAQMPSLKYQAVIDEPFRDHILELYETFYGNDDVLAMAVHRINRTIIHTTASFNKLLARKLADEKKLSFVLDCDLKELIKAGYIIVYSVSPQLVIDFQPNLEEYLTYSKQLCQLLWQKCNTSYEAASFYLLALLMQNLISLYATKRTGVICQDLHEVPFQKANSYLPQPFSVYELSMLEQAVLQPINGTYISNAYYKKMLRKVKLCVENV